MRFRITIALLASAYFFGLAQAESPPSPPVDGGRNASVTTISSASESVTPFKGTTTHVDPWSDLRRAIQCLVTDVDRPYDDAVDSVESETTVDTTTTAAPSEPTQPVDTFVSFEEWKKIKEAEEEEHDGDGDSDDRQVDIKTECSDSTKESVTVLVTERASDGLPANLSVKGGSSELPAPDAHVAQSDVKSDSSASVSQISSQQPPASSAPHHNRYNYASPDCSARIHSSSPQTQHASSLLHKSRDRYMLTPCKAKEHWVVVELCDEIRIEAVEVAVWEFFSGVVRELRVSVGGEDDEDYEDDPDDGVNGRSPKWKEVGSFIGKNVRGVQTFKLPQPTSFHRFIRLDFPSYFGTEYYCPVSQLKVYGMNQMEAFKWEQKRISAAAKEREKEKEKNGNNRDKDAEERRAKEEREKKAQKERDEKAKQELREKELDELEKLLHEQAGRVVPDILTETAILSKLQQSSSISSPSSKVPNTSKSSGSTSSSTSTRKEPPSSSTSASSKHNNTSTLSTETKQAGTNATADTSSTISSHTVSSSSSSSTSSSSPSQTKTITETPTSTSTYSRSPPPRSDSSESIYAFIIRRLNALEGNSTLVARYIEEQAKVMRHMLARVERGWDDWKSEWEGEDRGRWEQERMRQEDRLGRVISQLEQQKIAMEAERKEIQTQLRVLADELGYERRRGLAQLFIMFVIIVLGVITRSSTIDAVLKPLLAEAKRRRSMRKSFSGPLTGLRIDMGLGKPPAVIGQGRPRRDSELAQPAQRHTDRHRKQDGREGDRVSGRQGSIDDEDVRATSPASPTPMPSLRNRHAGNRNSISRRPGTPNSTSIRARRLPPGVVLSNHRSVSATDTITIAAAFSPSASSSALPTSAVSGGGGSVFLHSGLTSPAYKSSQPRSSLHTPRANGLSGPSRRLARSAHLHTMEADKLRHELKGKSRAHSVIEPGENPITGQDIASIVSNDGAVERTPRSDEPNVGINHQHGARCQSQENAILQPRQASGLPVDQISPFTIQLDDGRMPEGLPIDQGDHGHNGNGDSDGEAGGPSDWGTDIETEGSVSEVENEVNATGQAYSDKSGMTPSQEAVIVEELKSIWNGGDQGHGKETTTLDDIKSRK